MRSRILFVSFLSVAFTLFLASTASATPFFTNNQTFVNTTSVSNVMGFNATENVSFIVTINETLDLASPFTIYGIQNVTFRLGTPDGSYVNYSASFTGQNTNPVIMNVSQRFYINFTQSMLGRAGTYNFTWIARNATNRENSSVVYPFTLSKGAISIFLDTLMNNTANINGSISYPNTATKGNVSGRFNNTMATDSSFNLFRINSATGLSFNATLFNASFEDLSIGAYEYIYGAVSTMANYTVGNSTARNFTVNTGSQTATLLLGSGAVSPSAANLSVFKGETLNITAVSDATASNVSSNITVYANFTGSNITLVYSGSSLSAVYNTTETTGMTTGTYLISAYIGASLNYTAASNTSLYLTVAAAPAATTSSDDDSSGGGSSSTDAKHVTASPDGLSVTFQEGASHGVLSIVLETDSTASGVVVTVRDLSGRPASVTSDPAGKVYNYLSISKSGLEDSALSGARISFTVDSSWLSQNGYDASDVVLKRFHGGVWQSLVTTMTGSDSDSYTFEAETPGFSTFAVTAEKPVAVQPVEETAAPATDETSVPTKEGTTTSSEGAVPSSNDIILIGGVVVVAVVALVFIMRGKKPSKKR